MMTLADINTYYGDSHTLRGVSLELPAGTALGLPGRNGMGKTTLIRALMGYVRVAKGQLQWHGRDMTNAPPKRMARLGIGYVPEGRGIFPNSFGAREPGDDRARRCLRQEGVDL